MIQALTLLFRRLAPVGFAACIDSGIEARLDRVSLLDEGVCPSLEHSVDIARCFKEWFLFRDPDRFDFAQVLGDRLYQLRHRLDQHDVALVEYHAIRCVPLLSALYQDVADQLRFRIRSGLNIKNVVQHYVLGLQALDAAEE